MKNQYQEDLDDIDFDNYKGVFFEDNPTTKYTDPDTGAHFDFRDVCKRITALIRQRERDIEESEQSKSKNKLLRVESQSSNVDDVCEESTYVETKTNKSFKNKFAEEKAL